VPVKIENRRAHVDEVPLASSRDGLIER